MTRCVFGGFDWDGLAAERQRAQNEIDQKRREERSMRRKRAERGENLEENVEKAMGGDVHEVNEWMKVYMCM